MKKNLLLLICLLFSGAILAQTEETQHLTKFYANIGWGGGVSTNPTFGLLYDYDGTSTPPAVSVHPVGLGNGFNGYATFGFRSSKFAAVEVSVNEFLGLPAGGDSVVTLLGTSQSEAKIMGRLFTVVPAIVITAGLDKVNPYARFGLLIGPLPTVLAKYSTYNAKGNPPIEKEIYNKYYGGVAIGYAAAGGVSFNINKLISLFTEIQFTQATWLPDHSEITKYVVNGVDELSTLSPYEKQVDYVLTTAVSGPFDLNKPRQELKITMPFGTFAMNVGVTFKL